MPFDKVKAFLSDADLRVCNLESPLLHECSSKTGAIKGKAIHHCGHAKAVTGLKYAGFDLVQLANNHFADYGELGMKSTMKVLASEGIEYIGVTENSMKQKPVVRNINGIKIGFLAYCQNKEGCEMQQGIYKYGPAVYNRHRAKKDIQMLHQTTDIVVVMLHWSKEYAPLPPKGDRDIAKELSMFGVSLIIGTHPHVIQVTSVNMVEHGNFC